MLRKDYIFIGVKESHDYAFYQVKITAKQARVYAEYLKTYYGFIVVDYYPTGKRTRLT